MKAADHDLRLRIVLVAPPTGVDFGLQEGKGTAYRTVQTQRAQRGDLRFELVVKARGGAGAMTLVGPFAQGPAGARFLYLDIGTCAGQHGTPWTRRLKIPLAGISWADVERQVADPHAMLEARVAGTGSDGGPTCGTVKPFSGWKTVSSSSPRPRS